VEGEMDNATPGRITGTLRFVGKGTVTLDLTGDMMGELRGKRIRLNNPEPSERNVTLGKAGTYLRTFQTHQVGEVDSIKRVADGSLYAAWYDKTNGRVVLELPAAAWQEGK
jgi:hypothetical protein